MIENELNYWLALTQLRGWRTENVNNLIVKVLHNNKSSLEEFFALDKSELINKYELSEKECDDISSVKEQLPQLAFVVEDLVAQGYEIITINSPHYSEILKNNLKLKSSPPVLYIKGNKQILKEKSIAIIGSRDASEISLQFTDNIAKLAASQFRVVVSGFAKGVDKQALDSSIKYIGQSIIVLPNGIMTFDWGFKKYYQEIVRGDVLVLSTFFPKAPWSAQLAMARNPIIYGLADEIYVAQSADKGGTWAGVSDGLRRGRKIFVRYPEAGENNSNLLLIEKGAIPVDFDGKPVEGLSVGTSAQNNPQIDKDELTGKIKILLEKGEMSSKEIKEKLGLDLAISKLTNLIKDIDGIQCLKSRPVKFRLESSKTENLFS
ncbi:MAG: DNA-processing protein DprA [Bacteroidota bacterium]